MNVKTILEELAGGYGEDQRRAAELQNIQAFLNDLEALVDARPLVYVDVGAHQGDIFAKLCRSSLKVLEAHLVEPHPGFFGKLQSRVEPLMLARKATCHNVALSDRPGRLRLRDRARMRKAVDPTSKAVEIYPQEFVVEARTLDDLANNFISDHISLLKIDVGGDEAEVLAGGQRLLEKQAIDLIYVAAALNSDNAQKTHFRTIEDVLMPHKYRVFRIYNQRGKWFQESGDFAFMSMAFAARTPHRRWRGR